jgi:hypothetical protein
VVSHQPPLRVRSSLAPQRLGAAAEARYIYLHVLSHLCDSIFTQQRQEVCRELADTTTKNVLLQSTSVGIMAIVNIISEVQVASNATPSGPAAPSKAGSHHAVEARSVQVVVEGLVNMDKQLRSLRQEQHRAIEESFIVWKGQDATAPATATNDKKRPVGS